MKGKQMLWQHLPPPWQVAIEEAWTAYCHGSLPHGAVVTDAAGRILSRGRNRINEKEAEGTIIHGQRLAHAELNALLQTVWSSVENATCILYSTIEPCAMCVGAVRMANMREIRYAARDTTSGGTSLIDKTPFLAKGRLHVVGSENPELEIVLLAMLIESALSTPAYPLKEAWAAELATGLPVAGELGKQLYTSRQLRNWQAEGRTAAFVIDQLAEQAARLATV
jgi:tRNA(Arg) A34 adenosine deaminase TadA